VPCGVITVASRRTPSFIGIQVVVSATELTVCRSSCRRRVSERSVLVSLTEASTAARLAAPREGAVVVDGAAGKKEVQGTQPL
jgi:hypothetical protein